MSMYLRKLICFQASFLVVFVTVLGSFRTSAQTEPPLSARIINALKVKEPDWKYIGAIDNRFPIVPSQKRIVVGIWQGPKSRSQDVVVSVYSIENREEAAKWLQPVRDKHVAEGWHVSPFQIGDEGYLSKYRNGNRFEIEFRRGTVVANIAGDDSDRVKEFAQCIVEQIPAN